MDSNAVWLILAIVGAALMVGGIVAVRGSANLGIRSLGAASVAAGAVMWGIVLVTVPFSTSSEGSPSPSIEVEPPAGG